jgi:putative ABC transport system permease protein
MLYSKYLPLVWAGIWRKRGRAVLMLLQIVSAFALYGLLEGFNTGIKLAIAKTHGDRLYIGSSVSLGDPLPIGLLGRIRSIPGVEFVTMRSQLPGSYQQPDQQVGVIAVDVGAFFKVYDEFIASQADIDALGNNRTGTLVGRVTMEKYGWKVGDHVVLQSPVPKVDGTRDWAFDIVGAYDLLDDAAGATALIFNYKYFDESLFMGRDSAQMFVAKIDSAAHSGAISLAIDNAFANSDHETRTQSEADLAASQLQRIGDLNFLIRAIIAAVFFAMLFATGALMMQSIRERMPELAVLKTVGFSDRLVMALIVTEAITFCLFAAGIGLALAAFAFPLARQLIGIATLPRVVVAAGLGFAVLLGLIGSLVPAWRGLRLQVADALAGR